MDIIRRAAFFLLCAKCGRHGRVVCADGTESREFITVCGGLKELSELVLSEKVAEDEIPEVTRQIKESGLEYRNEEVEAILEKRGQKRSGLGEIFDEFHRELGGPSATKCAAEKQKPREKRTLQ